MPARKPLTAPNKKSREISEDKVVATTGKSSQEWYRILDEWGLKEKGRTQAVKMLREEYGLSPWWSQTMVIRYEFENGLRK